MTGQEKFDAAMQALEDSWWSDFRGPLSRQERTERQRIVYVKVKAELRRELSPDELCRAAEDWIQRHSPATARYKNEAR